VEGSQHKVSEDLVDNRFSGRRTDVEVGKQYGEAKGVEASDDEGKNQEPPGAAAVPADRSDDELFPELAFLGKFHENTVAPTITFVGTKVTAMRVFLSRLACGENVEAEGANNAVSRDAGAAEVEPARNEEGALFCFLCVTASSFDLHSIHLLSIYSTIQLYQVTMFTIMLPSTLSQL
jgi:hypothetical protein